jgi:hypothetical protein
MAKQSLGSWEPRGLVGAALLVAVALLACKANKSDSGPEKPATESARTAEPAVPACPARHAELPNDGAGEQTCLCAKGAATGSVWGSDIYTSDSSICAAAQHAGVITADGGKVTVRSAQGCPVYEGKERGGIRSASWESFDSSFYFPSQGNGKCLATAACPPAFKSQPNDSVSCNCGTINLGASVWGTDTYTTDSNLCAAAVHAGAITTAGGPVIAKEAGGCAKYVGSTRNGVTSRNWGSYPKSYYFPAKGDGKCP